VLAFVLLLPVGADLRGDLTFGTGLGHGHGLIIMAGYIQIANIHQGHGFEKNTPTTFFYLSALA